jgi:proton-coupled amino acid transporter
MVRNVVDFLYLYGHFVSCLFLPETAFLADFQAGEDLGEDDDDDEDEDSLPTVASTAGQSGGGPSSERAPLLGSSSRQGSKTRHKRSKSGPPVGTASVTQATLMVRPFHQSKEYMDIS